MQLLWLNLVSDVFPVLALAVQPPEANILERPPRDPREPFLHRSDYRRLGLQTTLLSASTLGCYAWGIRRYGVGPRASTLAFMSLTGSQLLHMLNACSDQRSIFSPRACRPNRWVAYALAGGLGLQIASIAIPGLRHLLGNTPVRGRDIVVSALGASVPFLVHEAVKEAVNLWEPQPPAEDEGK